LIGGVGDGIDGRIGLHDGCPVEWEGLPSMDARNGYSRMSIRLTRRHAGIRSDHVKPIVEIALLRHANFNARSVSDDRASSHRRVMS
jgi:hypothetical protein